MIVSVSLSLHASRTCKPVCKNRMRNFTRNTCVSVHFLKELYLGGLFTQFSLDSGEKLVINQAAVRSLPAVQMAIDRINNKSDGIYDKLLPNTQV